MSWTGRESDKVIEQMPKVSKINLIGGGAVALLIIVLAGKIVAPAFGSRIMSVAEVPPEPRTGIASGAALALSAPLRLDSPAIFRFTSGPLENCDLAGPLTAFNDTKAVFKPEHILCGQVSRSVSQKQISNLYLDSRFPSDPESIVFQIYDEQLLSQ
ncbi:hypothetical protein RKLH11_3977 [Rhodobacteraceae bacterium KLH11]|nr:hypothetical protein RKLH11_3977 [Rhodobacteraceae bacterium KLH11]